LTTCSKSKVTNARIVGNINENVVWLQITMYDAMAVDVAEAIKNLSEETPRTINVII
jgi:hypothetical protein